MVPCFLTSKKHIMVQVISFEEQKKARERVVNYMSKGPARVISVTSGKGGVGKTHTSVNLGLALVKLGKRVLLLDADLGLANINVLLGFKPAATLQDVLSGKSSIADILVNYQPGLDIIPASSGIPELTHLSEAERLTLVAAVDELGSDYDYMIVDTAAGIGDNVLYFNVAAEDILIVVTPEPTSITDAYAVIKVLNANHGIKNFNILVNQAAQGTDGKATYAQLAAATDRFLSVSLKFLGSIASDESVPAAVRQQKPYLQLFPSSKASLDISKLARKLVAEESTRVAKGGLQFFFKALLEQ